MTSMKTCSVCGRVYPARSDSKTCGKNCRNWMWYHTKKIRTAIKQARAGEIVDLPHGNVLVIGSTIGNGLDDDQLYIQQGGTFFEISESELIEKYIEYFLKVKNEKK